ncbi:MAG: tetratricopeptide repeat protein [bacterium]
MKKLIIFVLLSCSSHFSATVWADSSEKFLKEGVVLRDADNVEQAILKFQEILKSKPKHPGANFELGKSYVMKSDYENGIKYLKNALDCGYDELKVRLALAEAYQTSDNSVEASIEYQLILDLNPNSAEVHTLLGNVYLNGGNSTVAEEQYKKALQLNSSYVDALLGLGNLYQKQKKYEEALSFYSKAQKINPNYAPTYLALSSFYATQKKHENGITELQKYIQLNPKDPKGYTALANIYSQTKDYNNAINEMNKAVSYSDTSLSSLKFISVLYNQAGMSLKEKEVLSEIVLKDSTNVGIWIDLAKAYSKIDSFPAAIYAYNKAFSLDSTLESTFCFELGLACFQATKYDSSELLFSKKIERDSLAAGAYFNRALARIQLKKYKEGIVDLQKGLEIKPNYAQGHLWLAQTYGFLGMKQKAKAECAEVIKIDSTNKEVKDVLKSLEQPAKKEPTYEDYLDALDKAEAKENAEEKENNK